MLDQEGESTDVWEYAPARPSRGWINRPAILAFVPDGEGFLWVADEDGSKVEKCDMKGHRVETLDATALVQSEVRVRDIAVDPSMDRMFLCDASRQSHSGGKLAWQAVDRSASSARRFAHRSSGEQPSPSVIFLLRIPQNSGF